jgi:hypothetical protein
VSDLEDGSWVASPKSVEIQLIILQGWKFLVPELVERQNCEAGLFVILESLKRTDPFLWRG